jgi:Domain of unknown function (DUF5658)
MVRSCFFSGGRLWLRWLASRFFSGIGTLLYSSPLETVPRLVLLNLMLQAFDGLATYQGMLLGVQEGNPVMRAAMMHWGVAETLLGTKGAACLALPLFLLVRHRRLSVWALAVLAGFYLALSFVPWLTIFLSEAQRIWV